MTNSAAPSMDEALAAATAELKDLRTQRARVFQVLADPRHPHPIQEAQVIDAQIVVVLKRIEDIEHWRTEFNAWLEDRAATLTAETIQRAAGRNLPADMFEIRDHAGRAALALLQLQASTKGP